MACAGVRAEDEAPVSGFWMNDTTIMRFGAPGKINPCGRFHPFRYRLRCEMSPPPSCLASFPRAWAPEKNAGIPGFSGLTTGFPVLRLSVRKEIRRTEF